MWILTPKKKVGEAGQEQMITRIKIDGFKSFRNFEMEFTPLVKEYLATANFEKINAEGRIK